MKIQAILALGLAWLPAFCAAVDASAEPVHLKEPQADPRHQLTELTTRTRIKPNDLLKAADGSFPNERVVFRDTATGAQLWRLSHNPGYTRHRYSNYPIWNADGSLLMLRTERPGKFTWWSVEADGSHWRPAGKDFAGWHATAPTKYYLTREPAHGRGVDGKSEIREVDLATGQDRLLWQLPVDNIDLLPPSADGQKLLVVQKNGEAAGKPRSFAWLLNTDGTGEAKAINLQTDVHQIWFLKREDYAFTFNEEKRTLRADYGDRQWICEPLKDGAIRLLENIHFNHVGISPGGRQAAYMTADGLGVTEVATGQERTLIANHHGHVSWEADPRWFLASIDNGIYEIWPDENRVRLLCVPNSHLGYYTTHFEPEPENSPDGTKFGYASGMLGDCEFYVCVQHLPDPPRNLRHEGKMLTWDAPEHARELAGYGVYRGSQLLTPQPILERRFEVKEDAGDYTIVAIEHSGLQSPGPDQAPPPAPAELKAEARTPFAVALTWPRSTAPDTLYYNVYCSKSAPVEPVQASRIASPTGPATLDWGLHADTEYHYIVTAVDRGGNEGLPTAPVTLRTPAVPQRVLQRVAVGQSLGEKPITVAFEAPHAGRYLLWFELKPGAPSATGEARQTGAAAQAGATTPREEKRLAKEAYDLNRPLTIELDGKHRPSWRPLWDLVCDDRSGPVSVPFFDTLETECDPWHELTAGRRQITVTLPRGAAELVSLTLTNDAGFVPEGVTNFLAPGPKHKVAAE